MRFFSLYAIFFKQQIKKLLEYKQDFIIGVLSVFIQQIGMILTTLVIFTQLESLAGFDIYEIFLFYGFYIFVKGIDHFYNDNIWMFGWAMVRDGSFISILLRPINPILHIIMQRFDVTGFAEMIAGIFIIGFCQYHIGFSLGLIGSLQVLLVLICALAVYFSVKLLFSASAFWFASSGSLMTVAYETSNVARYPLDLFKNKLVQTILLFVLPFPISSYFPALLCLGKTEYFGNLIGWENASSVTLVIYCVIATSALLIVSLSVWYAGLRKYEPTGT